MPMEISAHGRKFMNMPSLGRSFGSIIPTALGSAAQTATEVSRQRFREELSPRPLAPPRSRRPTTSGRFADDILWEIYRRQNVNLDLHRLPIYALIQEIGTGETARILNPPGSVTVRSQRGREISQNLVFAAGLGQQANDQSGSGEQLYYAKDVNIQGVRRVRRVIDKEIVGKQYIKLGGRAGYLELEALLTDEAKRIFL